MEVRSNGTGGIADKVPNGWKPKQATQGGGAEGRGVCRDLDKPGGCQWGARCRYFHPEERGRSSESKTKDCVFWMEGGCKFSPEYCQGIHDQNKFKTKQPRQDKQDFVQALVKDAVSQALTGGDGGAQQGLKAGQGVQSFLQAGQGGQSFQQAGQGAGIFQQAGQSAVLHQNLPMQYVYQQQPNQMMMMPQNQLQPMMMLQQPGLMGQQVAWGGVQGSSQANRQ